MAKSDTLKMSSSFSFNRDTNRALLQYLAAGRKAP